MNMTIVESRDSAASENGSEAGILATRPRHELANGIRSLGGVKLGRHKLVGSERSCLRLHRQLACAVSPADCHRLESGHESSDQNILRHESYGQQTPSRGTSGDSEIGSHSDG